MKRNIRTGRDLFSALFIFCRSSKDYKRLQIYFPFLSHLGKMEVPKLGINFNPTFLLDSLQIEQNAYYTSTTTLCRARLFSHVYSHSVSLALKTKLSIAFNNWAILPMTSYLIILIHSKYLLNVSCVVFISQFLCQFMTEGYELLQNLGVGLKTSGLVDLFYSTTRFRDIALSGDGKEMRVLHSQFQFPTLSLEFEMIGLVLLFCWALNGVGLDYLF